MSLLTICQAAAGRIGINRPSVVAGSTDQQVLQLLDLVNEEGAKLSTGASIGLRYDWRRMIGEATFTAVAAEDQGDITTIAPGFKYIIQGTIYNRTLRRPVPGPLPPDKWQLLKAANVVGPYPQWRVRGNTLKLLPSPNAGDQIYFEYHSSYWALSATGTPKAQFSADDDTSVLDEDLLTQGLVWRWKRTKGLEYAEDFRDYQTAVHIAITGDGTAPVLNMGDPEYRPGVLIVPQAPGIMPLP